MAPKLGKRTLYRALTKEKIPTDKSFRLRKNEPTLSIALTPAKAMGTLDCKGWVGLDESIVLQIEGLSVRVKEGQPEPADHELLEIVGMPSFDAEEGAIVDYGRALVKAIVSTELIAKT